MARSGALTFGDSFGQSKQINFFWYTPFNAGTVRPTPRSVGALAVAEPADVDQLDAPVRGRVGFARVEQLLFAKSHGLDPPSADAEGVDQSFANGVGTLLAELEVVFTASLRVRVPHHQEAVALQVGMIQSVRHQSHSAERIRADARRIEVELDRDCELREITKLLGQWRTIHPVGA